MIPKTLHMVWLGSDEPEHVRKLRMAFFKHHPGWCIKTHTSWPSDTGMDHRVSACTQWCQVADLMYLHLLVTEGGIVLDTDVLALRSFNPLLNYAGWTTQHPAGLHGSGGRLTNGCMGSVAGSDSPFFECHRWACSDSKPSWGNKRCIYGPDMLTWMHDRGAMPGLSVLPSHYFYPYMWKEKDMCRTFWESTPEQRQWYLEQITARWVDKVEPYAVHLWHVFDTHFTPKE